MQKTPPKKPQHDSKAVFLTGDGWLSLVDWFILALFLFVPPERMKKHMVLSASINLALARLHPEEDSWLNGEHPLPPNFQEWMVIL